MKQFCKECGVWSEWGTANTCPLHQPVYTNDILDYNRGAIINDWNTRAESETEQKLKEAIIDRDRYRNDRNVMQEIHCQTEQKLKEAIEKLAILRSMTSCFRELDSSGHYDMLRDIDEELNDFLSTIKEPK
jgi:hypothetical protein